MTVLLTIMKGYFLPGAGSEAASFSHLAADSAGPGTTASNEKPLYSDDLASWYRSCIEGCGVVGLAFCDRGDR